MPYGELFASRNCVVLGVESDHARTGPINLCLCDVSPLGT